VRAMKRKKISMQHIANKLGITKVTVSKALNNQPGVSEELKKKIIETAHELGYYNKVKNLTSRTDHFAYLVSKNFFFENENFYTQIYYYLSKKCLEKNKDLSLFVINSEEEKNLSIPQKLNKENIDGIFLGGEISQAYLYALKNLNIPLVSIDYYKPNMKIDCILADNFSMSYALATYLIEKAHKRIGFFGNLKHSNYIDRYYGFQKALSFNNLPFSQKWNIINSNSDIGSNYIDFELPSDMPTAYVCECDLAAYFLTQKLQLSGYRVPDDISVISFDNTEISKTCNPPLTTVDINKKEFAEKAFNQLIARIESPDAPIQTQYIHTEIVERESVKYNKE